MITWLPRPWNTVTDGATRAQTCRFCQHEMKGDGRPIANATGKWSHFDCAWEAYVLELETFRDAFSGPRHQVQQRPVIDMLKEHGHIEAWHDKTRSSTDGRYFVRILP